MICPCGATPQLFLRVDAWITGAEKVLRPDIAMILDQIDPNDEVERR